jgi:4-amino-4-deoxy-L-arabinose transferase-like glycosyltransferase
VLGLLVAVSRIATSGPAYFVDGPAHIEAIRSRAFVIQPPGYWLFNRLAGFFPNPAAGIHILNWAFSVAGVVVFYYAARLLVSRTVVRLGAALYAVVFYAWFSGGIHSTYASQLLFPVLVFYFLLLHMRNLRSAHLAGASLAFGIGAGLRPSDGAFLGVMFVYYLVRYAGWKQATLAFALATAVCLAWLVPTAACYRATGLNNAFVYIGHASTRVSILTRGVNYRSVANIGRFFIPLALAFWPLAGAIGRTLAGLRDRHIVLLWLWIAPGAAYLVLCCMADAPYLNFLTPALLLLGMIALDRSRSSRRAWAFGLAIACNLGFFLFFRPFPTRSVAIDAVNVFAGKYTAWSIRHQWQPNLSDLHDRNAPLE